MEPGHEDREYSGPVKRASMPSKASMEPGHEDREYPRPVVCKTHCERGLNGARS